jgi:thymidylate synthase (FAD)
MTVSKDTVQVFDGYVKLHDVMGSDLTVVNAARVSYNRKKEILDEKDRRLIQFLAENGHTSPFRHATLQFEVYAPLMVARQWWKYVVGADHIMDGWNESSRRYITEECEFYVPNTSEWRSAPENKKQGSGDVLGIELGFEITNALHQHVTESTALYEWAMSMGVCAEQARLFLPAYGMYVRWYWTASLQSVAHLLQQRLNHDAQKEFQDYAKAVYELAKPHFPFSLEVLVNGEH